MLIRKRMGAREQYPFENPAVAPVRTTSAGRYYGYLLSGIAIFLFAIYGSFSAKLVWQFGVPTMGMVTDMSVQSSRRSKQYTCEYVYQVSGVQYQGKHQVLDYSLRNLEYGDSLRVRYLRMSPERSEIDPRMRSIYFLAFLVGGAFIFIAIKENNWVFGLKKI